MMTFFNLESLSWPSAPCLIKQENVFYTLSGREKKQNETDYVICTPDRKCQTVFARSSEATTETLEEMLCVNFTPSIECPLDGSGLKASPLLIQ